MSPERPIHPAERATVEFGGSSVTIEKRTANNASLGNAVRLVQMYHDARVESENRDDAFRRIGLNSLEELRLLYRYLDSAVSKNSGIRGRGKESEINQVKGMRDNILAPLFPDLISHRQGEEKGGRRGQYRSSKKWQPGGFDQSDDD